MNAAAAYQRAGRAYSLGPHSNCPGRYRLARGIVLPHISQMTLTTAYNEVTISPMNTGENEPQAAEIRRIQWVMHAGRRCGSILTARRNRKALMNLPGKWIDRVRQRRAKDALVLSG